MGARSEVDFAAQIEAQVDHAVAAEVPDRDTRPGVQRHEMETGRYQEYARTGRGRLPVGDAAPRIAPGRRPAALVQAVGPQRLAGPRVDGHGRATISGGRVEHPVHHEGRGAVVVLGGGAEVGRLPAPRDRQRGHVVAVDLVERRKAGAAGVAAVVSPLAGGGAVLGGGRDGPRGDRRQERQPRGGQQVTAHPVTAEAVYCAGSGLCGMAILQGAVSGSVQVSAARPGT